MRRPYLITGGCGFVGRNLTKRLLKMHKEVWVIDNLFTGRSPEEWLPKNFQKKPHKRGISMYSNGRFRLYFIKEDLVEFLSYEIKNPNLSILPKFSDVYHLASIVGGRELIEGDPLLVSKDLAIDSYFFLWVTRFLKKHQRVLYPSSSAAYPVDLQNKGRHALKESDLDFKSYIGVPDMTYGWSKVSGEFLGRLAAKKYGVKVACVRPFSGYGEDQELVYPIPAIAQRVAQKQDPLTVWGDGRQGRDFVYIDDCIDAFFVALDNISDGSALNIGSGKLTSFNEVLKIFCKIKGYQPKIKKLTSKPVGVVKRYANITKIKKLRWSPKIDNYEGFARVLAYAESQIK